MMKNLRSANALCAVACLAACLVLCPTAHAQNQVPYEKPGYYPARLLAPNVPLRGDQYQVRDKGYDDGLVATFWIDASDGTTYSATGIDQLYQRIAEIYAITQLRQIDSGKEFGNSLGNGAKGTVTAIGKTLSDPGKAISGIPQGASKFFGSLGEKLKGGKSQYEDKAYSDVLGASKAKRLLAFQLGVNPYSTNPTLQKELNRVGWSQAGATVTIHMATAAIPAGAGMALNMNRTAQAQVVENDPEQLNIINRKKLMAIGISQDTADLLIKHKWYSPLHRTVIADALVSLGPDHGQDVFLAVASRATSEVDANYFQQVAQLIEKYNKSEHAVQKIMRSGKTVSFVDANGTWVFPVPFDYCLWTQSVHERAVRLFNQRQPQQAVLVYTTGGLSDGAQQGCQSDKVDVTSRVSIQ
jgi:hypothetical protein